jgi:hypothetical protein
MNGYLCNNNGICNQQTSNCECYEGFTGLSCEKKIENEAKKNNCAQLKITPRWNYFNNSCYNLIDK